MVIFTAVLLILGVILLLVSSIMLLVAAFRESLWWGFGTLFIGPVGLIFTIVHWAEAKQSFMVSICGLVIVAAGIFTIPNRGEYLQKAMAGRMGMGAMSAGKGSTPEEKKQDLTEKIAAKRTELEAMEGQFAQVGPGLAQQYKDLGIRRKALKENDAAMVEKFNADAAAYQAANTQHKELKGQIDAAHKDLDGLLTERSKLAMAAPVAGN